MKVRRLSLIVVLVVLSAILLAAPVQAGRAVTEFVAWNTSIAFEWSTRTTGGVVHGSNSFVEGITSSDPKFQGTLTSHYECIGSEGHPQSTADYPWGPCNGVWRLEVPGSGGWWEGNAKGMPQSDFRVYCARATGKGYGAFAGMKVEWIQADLSEWGVQRVVRITGSE
jgi:hypothetical protein